MEQTTEMSQRKIARLKTIDLLIKDRRGDSS